MPNPRTTACGLSPSAVRGCVGPIIRVGARTPTPMPPTSCRQATGEVEAAWSPRGRATKYRAVDAEVTAPALPRPNAPTLAFYRGSGRQLHPGIGRVVQREVELGDPDLHDRLAKRDRADVQRPVELLHYITRV